MDKLTLQHQVSVATPCSRLGLGTQEINSANGGIKTLGPPTNDGTDRCGRDNATKTKTAQYIHEIWYIHA